MAIPVTEAGMHEPDDPHAAESGAEPEKKIHGRSPWQIAFERLRRDKIAVICTVVIAFFILIAIFAPLICKLFGVELRDGDPSMDTDQFSMPLVGPPNNGFTWDHPLGMAPETGNDLLAEWVYGARTSMMVAVTSTILATLIGIIVGLVAGYAKGWLDRIVNFTIDTFLSFPFILGALTIMPIVTSRFADDEDSLGTWEFIALLFVLVTFGWMTLARLIRGEVLSLREREFVQAAEVIGVPRRQVLFRELLPNLTAPIIVSISLGIPAFVTAEAGLSFLGIGITNTPTWGKTIASAQAYFESYPLYLWAPVLGVMILVLALNLLGDAIRDAFDPKTRR